MKKINYVFLAASAFAVTLGISSCGVTVNTPQADFEFTLELESKRNKVYKNDYDDLGKMDKIVVHEINKKKGDNYNYTFSVKKDQKDYVQVTSDGHIKPLKYTDNTVSTIRVTVTAEREGAEEEEEPIIHSIPFKITDRNPSADRGANFSADKAARTDVLGDLESFAMNNFLTGITLFENGGWVRYQDRVTLGSENYIAGYGFGLLSEGKLDGTLSGVTDKWGLYLRTATSSETYSINAWDNEGSQVSDLNGYITSSFWSTRIAKGEEEQSSSSEGKYEWYPCLARDEVKRYDLENGGSKTVSNTRPVPVDDNGNLITSETKNAKGLYNRWRVYVKTGSQVKYRTAADNGYDNRQIQLEDYVFPFKMLLTQSAGTFRGAELASDTSYGFKGAYSYFRKTETATTEKANEEWERMTTPDNETGEQELGIYTGTDETFPENGEYIEFEFINPIDDFTAMYTLSSNLYSPLPEAFLDELPGTSKGWVEAAKLYGTYGKKPQTESDTHWFTRNMLCVGPFYLEQWDTNSQIVFARNDDWFEVGDRYHIPGVHISIETAAQKLPDTMWNLFNKKKLDSAGIPKSYLANNEIPEPGKKDKQTKGDSTFKLNVNSCDQERSDYLFGTNGVIEKHQTPRTVHPWMANNNFLRGLFWSVKREDFATALGVNPSYEYFADAYLADVENENYDPEVDPIDKKYISAAYNTTDQHKAALESFGINPEDTNYGYDKDKAITYFQSAVAELLLLGDKGIKSLGTKSAPRKITIDIWWMYQSEIEEYGKDIKNYFEETFNDNNVANSCLKLVVKNHSVTDWQDVYKKHLMTGEFDLGFGAISGNTLNPLNFLEVLRSDNSSGFTLNWGADTSKKSETFPIVYNGEEWTFDSLWAAADHGVIASDGEEIKAVESAFMKAPRQLADINKEITSGRLGAGGYLYIPFNFVKIANDVTFDITKVQIYLPGTDNLVIKASDLEHFNIVKDAQGHVIRLEIRIDQAVGEDINQRLYECNDLDEEYQRETDPQKKDDLLNPFRYAKYDIYWSVEVYYDLKIAGSEPVENVYYVSKSESDVENLIHFLHM